MATRTRTTLRTPAERSGKDLAATTSDKELLGGLEPDRQLDDWGRSERVAGWFDRTLYEFFYKIWFRTEVEGAEHVPAGSASLLVSNHSGALPPDAAMISKAVKEHHGIDVRILVEHFFKGYPGFSMLLPKIGAVPAHPANVHRLLADEDRCVLVFPEGRKGTEKLYRERYQLRRFGRGGFVEAAMRAHAPIVPVAVVGAEESMPVFGQIAPLAKLTGLIYAPIAPLLPVVLYLPAKFHIRFLEPVRTDDMGDEPWLDKGLVQSVSQDIRARIQDELYDMLGARRSIWL